jgi:hypothetical protein
VTADPRQTIAEYWRAIGARDWPALGAVLADDVVYDVPQSRERVRGRDGVIRFNAEYPGDWTIDPVRVVAADLHGASWIDFRVDDTSQPGLTFFDLDDTGRIAGITDFWPEPYDPPSGREHLVERY